MTAVSGHFSATVLIFMVTLGKPFVDILGMIHGAAHTTRNMDLQLFNGGNYPRLWSRRISAALAAWCFYAFRVGKQTYSTL
ncbi:MAG: hypothetical protein SOW59_08985 [Corynebacterium sp.]|nr:hypothetical protein [Corynebacterium sp.]